jgi:hypothetical protein
MYLTLSVDKEILVSVAGVRRRGSLRVYVTRGPHVRAGNPRKIGQIRFAELPSILPTIPTRYIQGYRPPHAARRYDVPINRSGATPVSARYRRSKLIANTLDGCHRHNDAGDAGGQVLSLGRSRCLRSRAVARPKRTQKDARQITSYTVPKYRAVMLDGGEIKRVMFVDEKDERLSTWKPGHNITFCPDQDKVINTTINSVATLLSEDMTTCKPLLISNEIDRYLEEAWEYTNQPNLHVDPTSFLHEGEIQTWLVF